MPPIRRDCSLDAAAADAVEDCCLMLELREKTYKIPSYFLRPRRAPAAGLCEFRRRENATFVNKR